MISESEIQEIRRETALTRIATTKLEELIGNTLEKLIRIKGAEYVQTYLIGMGCLIEYNQSLKNK